VGVRPVLAVFIGTGSLILDKLRFLRSGRTQPVFARYGSSEVPKEYFVEALKR
jgi:hypothetical protein